MTRQEIIDLICAKADANGLDRVEFLGGAVAESGLDPNSWRQGIWPDWSAGLYQQTVLYADEGDHTASPENVTYIKQLYFDPAHACDVAATKFKYWRYNPDVSALTAWCAYNWPGSYHTPEINPNINNYRDGLAEAARILGQSVPSTNRTYGPEVPNSVILQQNDWSCAVRSTYGALWSMSQLGQGQAVTYGDGSPRDVYGLLVPQYDDPSVGLHQANGQGLVEALAKWGYIAYATSDVPISAVQSLAGTKPILLGGRAWNHWVFCRGVEPDGTLMLANPSPGFAGIQNEIRDSFTRLGPFTMVAIDIPTVPVPTPQFTFQFGMADKANELGETIVGTPIEAEHYVHDYVSIQLTTKGMMLYVTLTGQVFFFPKN